MGRSPAFTTLVVATLGLGIGANTAIFSLVEGVLLKPLPFRDPDALMMVWGKRPSVPQMAVSELDFDDYRARTHVFQDLGGFVAPGAKTVILTGVGEPAEVAPAFTTRNYFSLLGIKPLLGRDFLPEEGRRGHGNVAILSYALWQSRFGGSGDVLGRQITLNQQKLDIVGVMGPQAYPAEADVFVPFVWIYPEVLTRNFHQLNVIGRLRPGQTAATAQKELEAIAGELGRSYPTTNAGISVHVLPLREEIIGSVREPLLVLQAAAVLILLIAFGNAANLLIVRSVKRQKEIAIRVALGAGRSRIIWQFAAECLMLSSAGAILGLLLAIGIMPLIRFLAEGRIPRLQHAALDGRVLLFTTAAAVLAGLLFELMPVLKYSSANLNRALRAGGRTARSDSARLRNVLVAGEVALAMMVIVGASLLIRSLNQLTAVRPGFRTGHVLTAHIRLPWNQYKDSDVHSFYQRLLPKIAAIPGISGVSTTTTLPLVGPTIQMRFALQGISLPEPGKYPTLEMVSVNPDFFRIMDVPILRGRTFKREEVDDFDHQKCIISQTFSNTYFSGQNAIGRLIVVGIGRSDAAPCEVVGVAGDTHLVSLDKQPQATLYYPAYVIRDNLVMLTAGNPLAIAQAVQREVSATLPGQPISNIRTMDEVVTQSLSRRAFAVVLLGMFSVLGLILAALGLYGVVSYSVTQRTQEIGLRMALGARPADVFRMVLWQGLLITGAGLMVGAMAAGSTTRLISSLLFGITATDLFSFEVGCLLLLAISALACFFPAYRATRVDPVVALRYE
jgi:putative ABC transport system permease protein